MSKKIMFSWLAQPYIFDAGNGIQKTDILFAISDKAEVAWYIYKETSSEFAFAELEDEAFYYRFAGKNSSGQGFVPKNVTWVTEFANGFIKETNGNAALARLSLHRIGGDRIQIFMNLYLKTGPQLIQFTLLESKNPMDLPANHEWGQVSLLKAEKKPSQFGSYLLDPIKIRNFGVMRPRLFHPKPHAR